MALSARQRWFVLGGALAVTLGLAAWLGNRPEEPAEAPAAQRPPAAADKPAGPAQSGRVGQLGDLLPPERAKPAGPDGEIKDIFAAQSWRAPAPTEAAAPSAPEMPALPFTYFGKLIDGRRVTVYLAAEDRHLAVRQGDVIDGTWRVDSIGPTVMVFRYLPMGRKQSLEIGRAK